MSETPPLLREYFAHDETGRLVMLGAYCPACKFEHAFRVDEAYWAREGKDTWKFTGTMAAPTFEGSMGVNLSGDRPRPVCHSLVEDGCWRYLEDSTHELAGQTVPMVPYPDSYIRSANMA